MNYRRYNYTDCYGLLRCFFLCFIFAYLFGDLLSFILGVTAFVTGLFLLSYRPWRYFKISYRLWQLNRYKIPQDVEDAFKANYPRLTQKQYRLIVAGFKDFIALYLLDKKRYYLPSHAVNHFIKVYARHGVAYQTMWQQFLSDVPRYYVSEQKSALASTFKMACYLNKVKPSRQLPRLFKIDEQLQDQLKDTKIFDHFILFSNLSFDLKKSDRYTTWFRKFFKIKTRCSSYSNSDTDSSIDFTWDSDSSSDSSSCDSSGGCD